MVGLGSDEIAPIAEKRLAPLFGQPFVLAKIIKPKIPDHDLTRSFVIAPPIGPIQSRHWPLTPVRDTHFFSFLYSPKILASLDTSNRLRRP